MAEILRFLVRGPLHPSRLGRISPTVPLAMQTCTYASYAGVYSAAVAAAEAARPSRFVMIRARGGLGIALSTVRRRACATVCPLARSLARSRGCILHAPHCPV